MSAPAEPVVVTAGQNAFTVSAAGYAAIVPLCMCDRTEPCRGWTVGDIRRFAGRVARTFTPRREVVWR